MPRVFVSGCFDLLHSGHVAFLKSATEYGELHVCIGSDRTIHGIKGRWTVNDEQERRYMLEALTCVHAVHIGSGSGLFDFLPELEQVKPDVFVVNSDGSAGAGGGSYLVLESTTAIPDELRLTIRLNDL